MHLMAREEYRSATIVKYEGSGTLEADNGKTWPCSFQALQLNSGDIVLLSELSETPANRSLADVFLAILEKEIIFSSSALRGHTTDGQSLEAIELSAVQIKIPYCTHLARHLVVNKTTGVIPTLSRFGVTNLEMQFRELKIVHPDGTAIIRPVQNYEQAMARIKAFKSVDVTAEIEMDWAENGRNIDVIDAICYLLSLAAGSKVNWIYRDDYTPSGEILRRSHRDGVTKRYSALRAVQLKDVKSFVEEALPVYLERNKEGWQVNVLVDSFLDATQEGDFLEMRGVKLAVTGEMIKSAFLKAVDYEAQVVPTNKFKKIRKKAKLSEAIKEVLKAKLHPHLQEDKLERLCETVSDKLVDLNRLPFKRVLKDLRDHLELEVTEEELARFANSRDTLIHEGRFHCGFASEETGAGQLWKEYRSNQSFISRLLLRLVGYGGQPCEW